MDITCQGNFIYKINKHHPQRGSIEIAIALAYPYINKVHHQSISDKGLKLLIIRYFW